MLFIVRIMINLKRIFSVFIVLVCLSAVSFANATSKEDLSRRVIHSQNLLNTLMSMPEYRIPEHVLAKSKAIVFVDTFSGWFCIWYKGWKCHGNAS